MDATHHLVAKPSKQLNNVYMAWRYSQTTENTRKHSSATKQVSREHKQMINMLVIGR